LFGSYYCKDEDISCDAIGFQDCGLACAKDRRTCAGEIMKMTLAVIKGLMKFAALLNIPGSSVLLSIVKIS